MSESGASRVTIAPMALTKTTLRSISAGRLRRSAPQRRAAAPKTRVQSSPDEANRVEEFDDADHSGMTRTPSKKSRPRTTPRTPSARQRRRPSQTAKTATGSIQLPHPTARPPQMPARPVRPRCPKLSVAMSSATAGRAGSARRTPVSSGSCAIAHSPAHGPKSRVEKTTTATPDSTPSARPAHITSPITQWRSQSRWGSSEGSPAARPGPICALTATQTNSTEPTTSRPKPRATKTRVARTAAA